MAEFLLPFGQHDVRDEGCTVAVQCFDNSGDEAEGCDDSPWVDGRVVGDVVQNPAQNDVVCELVHGWCAVYETHGDDVFDHVGIIESADFSSYVAGDED